MEPVSFRKSPLAVSKDWKVEQVFFPSIGKVEREFFQGLENRPFDFLRAFAWDRQGLEKWTGEGRRV